MRDKRWMTAVLVGALALGLMAAPGLASARSAAKKSCVKRPVAARTFNARKAMIEVADSYSKSSPAHIISATDLHNVVLTADPAYQIVDVRSAAHFALGHIEGAINIPFQTIADDASLAMLDHSKKIVVVCYTGETSSQTTMVWSMLGYDTRALLFGMSGWVADKAIVGIDIPSGVAAGYPTTTDVPVSHRTYRAPQLSAQYANVAEAVKGQTKAYFAKGLAPVMTATQVNEAMQANGSSYQVISVRETADYASGHLVGATNLVWTDIANQLDKLDPNKTTIVYCYTGNIGGEDAMFLNLMGYTAYNMMSGMSSWNADPAVGGFVGFNPANAFNFPVVR